MDAPDPGESVRKYFAYHLIRLRKERNQSQGQVAKGALTSQSVISGLETWTRIPTLGVATGLDTHFGVPQFFAPLVARIEEEAGVPAGFPEFQDHESVARVIRFYDQFIMNGLLQVGEYAEAVLASAERPDKVPSQLKTRMGRQAILTGDDPPLVIALIDEGALRHRVGGPEVMRKQYEHLLKIVQGKQIALYVVPAETALYPEASFKLLSLEGGQILGYAEIVTGRGVLIEPGPQLAEMEVVFEMIRRKSLSESETEQLIRHLLEQL